MNRTLEVIFCDDVRTETNNKVSFMGIYGGSLIVGQLPAALTKLCIVPSFSTPVDQPFRELEFVVIADAKESGRVKLPADAVDSALKELAIEPLHEKTRRLAFRSVITIAPFVVEAPSVLQLDAIVDGERFEGSRLRIFAAKQIRQSDLLNVPFEKSSGAIVSGRTA